MQLIKVKTENSSYSIHVEKGLFENVPVMLEPFNHGQTWVIFTHPILNDLYGKKLAEILQSAGFISITITMPEGEQSKTIGQVNDLYEQLLSHNCDRSTTFIALGGGVVGDVTGFVASTFMRGVDYIQIPTTLLAMVDSSVGGKTGVNLPRGKNLVGTFYQPRLVLIDPNLLHSLPLRDIVAGLAEVLKYGAIHNKDFFIKTAENLQLLSSLVSEAPITETIAESCRIKAQIVSEDEKETGLRRILNFGHTIGHALEIGNTRPVLRHGEAVA
ncbi:MAG: 3-dehydroquinate synthase [FCB group bacterium]|nr:3-dehydroquinate synthase [FCB group bacterium]